VTRTTPFPPWPYFAEDEIAAAARVLVSGKVNYLTGQEGHLFEQEFAQSVGRKHAIALANGTLALELALYTLGIGPDDEVIVPCRTFIATASSVVMRGAKPIMADIDPESQNITAETIAAVLTPRTKAIIPVHLSGLCCDMDPIIALAREHNLYIIEDCAQAVGSLYKGKPAGTFGHVATFSFCQDKIITTAGEGGMLLMDDTVLFEKAWGFKDHGKNYQSMQQKPTNVGFRWLHDEFGTNWRLSEVQSAIGRLQLRKVSEWVEKRRKNAALLVERFSKLPALKVPLPSLDYYHSYYKFWVFVRPELLKSDWNRDRILTEINARGIPCFTAICPEIYLEKAFINSAFAMDRRLPQAEKLGAIDLTFLVHPTCQIQDIMDTCLVVEQVMQEATVSTCCEENFLAN
jgi:dTDP-4-amino-4,6-dideoxygalactose transaminase